MREDGTPTVNGLQSHGFDPQGEIGGFIIDAPKFGLSASFRAAVYDVVKESRRPPRNQFRKSRFDNYPLSPEVTDRDLIDLRTAVAAL